MGNPVVFLPRTRSVLAAAQPVGQTSTVVTAGTQMSTCCQVNHASRRRALGSCTSHWRVLASSAIGCSSPLLEAMF